MPEWLHLNRNGTGPRLPRLGPRGHAVEPRRGRRWRRTTTSRSCRSSTTRRGHLRRGAAHVALATPRTRGSIIGAIRDFLLDHDFQGINVDLENLRPADYPKLPLFVGELRDSLRERQSGGERGPGGVARDVARPRPVGRLRLRGADELRAARPGRGSGAAGGDRLVRHAAHAGGGGGARGEAGGRHRELRGGLAAPGHRGREGADGPGLPGGGAGRAPRRPAGEPGGLRPDRAQPHLRVHRRRGGAARGVDAGRGDGLQRPRARAARPGARDGAVGARLGGPVPLARVREGRLRPPPAAERARQHPHLVHPRLRRRG